MGAANDRFRKFASLVQRNELYDNSIAFLKITPKVGPLAKEAADHLARAYGKGPRGASPCPVLRPRRSEVSQARAVPGRMHRCHPGGAPRCRRCPCPRRREAQRRSQRPLRVGTLAVCTSPRVHARARGEAERSPAPGRRRLSLDGSHRARARKRAEAAAGAAPRRGTQIHHVAPEPRPGRAKATLERCEIVTATGKRVYDVFTYAGDSGTIFATAPHAWSRRSFSRRSNAETPSLPKAWRSRWHRSRPRRATARGHSPTTHDPRENKHAR